MDSNLSFTSTSSVDAVSKSSGYTTSGQDIVPLFAIEIATPIKNQQFTDKIVINTDENNNIKVKIIQLTNDSNFPTTCLVQLVQAGGFVNNKYLSTKTRAKKEERYKILSTQIYAIEGTATAIFKICIKKAIKKVKLYFTAENCRPTCSEYFSVFSNKKNSSTQNVDRNEPYDMQQNPQYIPFVPLYTPEKVFEVL